MIFKKKITDKLTETVEHELKNLYRYAFYRIGNKQDAEDIIQNLYLSMYSKGEQLTEIDNLKSYIYRALSNNCTLLLRKRQQNNIISIESTELTNIAETEPRNIEEEFNLINTLLDIIPDEQSEVIRLHIHGNRTFVDIADILKIPITTAKSRFKYGIEKLRKEIEKADI